MPSKGMSEPRELLITIQCPVNSQIDSTRARRGGQRRGEAAARRGPLPEHGRGEPAARTPESEIPQKGKSLIKEHPFKGKPLVSRESKVNISNGCGRVDRRTYRCAARRCLRTHRWVHARTRTRALMLSFDIHTQAHASS